MFSPIQSAVKLAEPVENRRAEGSRGSHSAAARGGRAKAERGRARRTALLQAARQPDRPGPVSSHREGGVHQVPRKGLEPCERKSVQF